jgi:hypothetical protein
MLFIHPASVCMSYSEHFLLSMRFAGMFFIGSIKAVIHAIYPDVFITSTSKLLRDANIVAKAAGCD